MRLDILRVARCGLLRALAVTLALTAVSSAAQAKYWDETKFDENNSKSWVVKSVDVHEADTLFLCKCPRADDTYASNAERCYITESLNGGTTCRGDITEPSHGGTTKRSAMGTVVAADDTYASNAEPCGITESFCGGAIWGGDITEPSHGGAIKRSAMGTVVAADDTYASNAERCYITESLNGGTIKRSAMGTVVADDKGDALTGAIASIGPDTVMCLLHILPNKRHVCTCDASLNN